MPTRRNMKHLPIPGMMLTEPAMKSTKQYRSWLTKSAWFTERKSIPVSRRLLQINSIITINRIDIATAVKIILSIGLFFKYLYDAWPSAAKQKIAVVPMFQGITAILSPNCQR